MGTSYKRYDFAIGIPTINRWDLLSEALKRYDRNLPEVDIIIVDNGNQDISGLPKNAIVLKQENNIGVAASWNLLCNFIFRKYSWAIILNDDVETDYNQIQFRNLIAGNKHIGFFKSKKEWSLFGLNKATFETVGKFDEKFYPAYYEDNDYMYRMKLAGIRMMERETLDPLIYRNSMSIRKEPSLNKDYMMNHNYYIKKWGGKPGEEKYNIPFGL